MSGWRHALRIGLVLTCLAGSGFAGAAPAGAAAAFSTELSGLPDEFTGGNRVETLSAVVSRSDRGRAPTASRCAGRCCSRCRACGWTR